MHLTVKTRGQEEKLNIKTQRLSEQLQKYKEIKT